MQFLRFALPVFALALMFSACNRGQKVAETQDKEPPTVIEGRDLAEIDDHGAEAVKYIEETVTLTDEQKEQVKTIANELGFDDSPVKEQRDKLKMLRKRVRKEVLTAEQIGQYKNSVDRKEKE